MGAALLRVSALLALFPVGLAGTTGEGVDGYSQALGRWASQYVLFNGTHVILTFLLVGARRELLHTTRRRMTRSPRPYNCRATILSATGGHQAQM